MHFPTIEANFSTYVFFGLCIMLIIADRLFHKACAEHNRLRLEALSRCLLLKCMIACADTEDLISLAEEIREFRTTYSTLVHQDTYNQTCEELRDAWARRAMETAAAA